MTATAAHTSRRPAAGRRHLVLRLACLLLPGLLHACAAALPYTTARPAALRPPADQAMVVFLYPSHLGTEQFSAVNPQDGSTGSEPVLLYDGDIYIGHLPQRMQLAYTTTPGKHYFMSAAFNADFLEADLQAGGTYFVLLDAVPMAVALGTQFKPQNGPMDDKLAILHKTLDYAQVNRHGIALARSKEVETRRRLLRENNFAKWQADTNHAYLGAGTGE